MYTKLPLSAEQILPLPARIAHLRRARRPTRAGRYRIPPAHARNLRPTFRVC